MKKVFAVLILLCFLICLIPAGSAQADSFPSEFFVNSEVYYSAEEMFTAYISLTGNQQDIAAYLLGMYNLMYLGARGFQFRQGAYRNESEFLAKIRSFGYQFFQGAAEISLKSRMDDEFCKYASACILYASQCNNVSFSTWFENLDDTFVIPVDQGIINSFTLLYNDNSSEALAVFGDEIGPWESGTYNMFLYPNAPSNIIAQVNQVTNGMAMVQFSDMVVYSSNESQQFIAVSNTPPDTVFIKRQGSGYQNYAYGAFYSGGWHRVTTEAFHVYDVVLYRGSYSFNDRGSDNFYKSIISSSLYIDLSQFIAFIFNSNYPNHFTPGNGQEVWNGYYPYINHVVLVDDLNTLSNPVEVFNMDSWDVIGVGKNLVTPVDAVELQPKIIATINLPDNSQQNVDIQDIINENNTVDQNGDPVNPWQITIVVQPNETNPISIDVNMFLSAKVYIEYLWNNATAFLSYCKDLLDCFAFTDVNGADYGPKYAIYGVIVLGVASGLIAKFLL